MKTKSAIGILGGMGSGASAYLYNTLNKLAVRDFGAENNDDFPEIILHSIPVPDFISSDAQLDLAREMLQTRVSKLNKLNISCLSIACNSAHILLNDLQPFSKVQIISMIKQVATNVHNDRLKKVGILATPNTISKGLYQDELKAFGIKTIVPNKKQLKILEKIIRNILAGKIRDEDRKKLVEVAQHMIDRGAEGIVLGCTELPLLFPKYYSAHVYSSVEILARALLEKYYSVNLKKYE